MRLIIKSYFPYPSPFQCPPEYSDSPMGTILYHISAAQFANLSAHFSMTFYKIVLRFHSFTINPNISHENTHALSPPC